MRKHRFPLIELYIVIFLIVVITVIAVWVLGQKWGVEWWKAILYVLGALIALPLLGGIMEFICGLFSKSKDKKKK